MGNGEWEMGNGEWGMGNREWGMGKGERGKGNGKLKWEIENGKLNFFTRSACKKRKIDKDFS